MEYDFLVLGSGIAGLTFAINAAPHGSVAILTKKQRSESNTNYAQGGIAAAIGADDSWELHLQDTLNAGAGLCDRESVEVLVKNGPRLMHWLMDLGAQFDQNPDGSIALGREGGHSRNRILHAADHTGYEIERALLIAARKTPHITLLEHYQALELILENGVCAGVQVLDTLTGDLFEIRAKAILLATGGCGQVYLHTSNPPIATGDGIAMAWRAGATVGNMEFIQFHPTTLYHTDAPSFLISEAVRGEGGILRRRDGYRFMPDYDPRAELAPRDIVARAIDAELKKTGDPCVFLDITHLDPEFVQRRFPTIYHTCLQYGVDITQEPIPVVPAAHYTCGGVWTDLDGRTTIPRLYACGEVAYTGVHGANRLASNSLLEALVFAERAALHAATRLDQPPPKPKPSCITAQLLPIEPAPEVKDQAYNWDADRLQIRKTMQKQVGIVRTVARLQEAQCALKTLAAQVEAAYRVFPPTVESCEARNLAACALLITHSALARQESRGLHYVLDYPETRAECAACPTLIAPA
ncbi:MAG: L-aspartate oxidase [Fimbriimonadales bacterium]|nr:MAG: L-aspartate oxidase [Fimbriimonadales bacterium]GIV10824.1 MAG: L-aspartate oxidase [Fimbriimonadales bacterium]